MAPRTIHRLRAVALIRPMPAGYHADGGGLYLQVTEGGAKSWIFRYSKGGKRPEMGLGPYSTKTERGAESVVVSLEAARSAAAEARALVKSGQDPLELRQAERDRLQAEKARGVTFQTAAKQYIGQHEGTWRNPKHRQQWKNTLATYVYPTLGNVSVAAIGKADVTKILDPIWHEKPETAHRVRGRIERILDWAKGRGYRSGENPARWRGHLDAVYPTRAKVRKVKHHAAVAIDDMPSVYARLCQAEGVAALAARFTILTAVRVGETTGGTKSETTKPDLWAIPAERMKADRDHNVPLSGEAREVLRLAKEHQTDDRLFPGRRAGRPLSYTAVIKALRAAGAGDATTHGCRSTFRDWASERTSFPSEVAEMALAHAIDDKTEAAYRRGELLKKRTALMEAWAQFVSTPRGAKVVPLARRAV
jgi:integrase